MTTCWPPTASSSICKVSCRLAWLYINQAYGYVPPPEEIVGPVIIDETTAADWKARLVNLFGEETYNELAGW